MWYSYRHLWLEYKHDSSGRNWTVNYPQHHLSSRSWLFCLLSEPGSIGKGFGLVSGRFDNNIFRSWHVASVMVSKMKFEARGNPGFGNLKTEAVTVCSDLQIVFITNQADDEESALPPTCASGCISPTYALCQGQKSCPVVIHCIQQLWCFDGEKLLLLQ